jgi:hypothetical protein
MAGSKPAALPLGDAPVEITRYALKHFAVWQQQRVSTREILTEKK